MSNQSIGGLAGERDGEIGRRLEKAQAGDAVARRKQAMQANSQMQKGKTDKDWKLEKEKLESEDAIESEKKIKQLKKFLQDVAKEGKERQEEMRKRNVEIIGKMLEAGSKKSGEDSGDGLGELVVPEGKKREGFMSKVQKKGSGGIAEARGSTVKGGG